MVYTIQVLSILLGFVIEAAVGIKYEAIFMMGKRRYLTNKKICDSSSKRKFLQDPHKEFQQQIKTTNITQVIGQKLNLSQNSISTAIVYVHRFYVAFSFEDVDFNKLAMVAVFLAGKTQNEYRKIEHVIKVGLACTDNHFRGIDVKSEAYFNIKEELIFLESVLLQILGFDVDVEHPHPYVVKICQLIRGSESLAKKAYILATACLMVSRMCLEYKPTTVACVCVNLGAKWSKLKIQTSAEERPWFYFVCPSLTAKCLNELTDELGRRLLSAALKLKSSVLNCAVGETSVDGSLKTIKEKVTKCSNKCSNGEKASKEPVVFSQTHGLMPARCGYDANEIVVKCQRNFVFLK